MGLQICVDQILPEEKVIAAATRAIAENPANAGSGQEGLGTFELAVNTKMNWPTGRVLKIRFLGGHPKVRARVMEVSRQWCEHANLAFDFGDHSEPDIRIAFEDGGSWSWLGTHALTIEQERPTMNFGWLEPGSAEEAYHRVVLHEFGHALGCIHEHQSPAGGVPWDEPKVYEYYMSQYGWSKMKVYENLLEKYSQDSTQFGEFDRESIMIYAIPKELTIDDYEVKWNTELSDMDKKMIGEVYP